MRRGASSLAIEDGVALVYHSGMRELREELATLSADVAEAVEASRLLGTADVPCEPEGVAVPSARAAPRVLPAPRPAPPVVRPAPPPRAPAATAPATPAPTPTTTLPAPPLPPAAPVQGGGLLGRWAAQVAGPAERLRVVQERLGERCSGCGEPMIAASGGLESGMALLYDRGAEADQSVLTNMLVRVVGVEPADVFTLEPRTCGSCAEAAVAQLEAIRPRVILALGPLARAMTRSPPGAWTRLAGTDAVGTWHPSEQGSDAAHKRAVFDVLKQVASRR